MSSQHDRDEARHDRLAAHELLHFWYWNYDQGNLSLLERLLTDDCHVTSRTELGVHAREEFIRGDNRGRIAAMAWMREHRRRSPYPLRHNLANVFVAAVRRDELDMESYLLVTNIVDGTPSPLSSGVVHWTLVVTDDGYRVRQKHTVLDSIASAPFHTVEFVRDREQTW